MVLHNDCGDGWMWRLCNGDDGDGGNAGLVYDAATSRARGTAADQAVTGSGDSAGV